MKPNPKFQIIKSLQNIVGELDIKLEIPEREGFGDYSSNVAMATFENAKLQMINAKWKTSREYAEFIKSKLDEDTQLAKYVEKIEVAGPGFINFHLARSLFTRVLGEIVENGEDFGKSESFANKKTMVEFAHPNTHKELHIGHMRTLILGETLSRIYEANGAQVFRANYQGDIGPHVAKAIWGTQKLLEERGQSWDDAEKLSLLEKAHLLGEGYIKGSSEYDAHKEEIDQTNTILYRKDAELMPIYERTRGWSLGYYDLFYKRFGTKFDKLYFESEVAESGKKIVEENIGKVFEKSEGAVVFNGEKYGLHTRVFITKDGNPTYEGKDIGLVYKQFEDFSFDRCIHVVANEQKGYFSVIIKAIELIDEKFKGREYHLPMGMVNLVGLKMASRTGEILRVDQLLDEVKNKVKELAKEDSSEGVSEMVTMGAVKYSMLKVHPTGDVTFDINKSVSLEGDSGPYLQYTYARTRSVLHKAQNTTQDIKLKTENNFKSSVLSFKLTSEELSVLRSFIHFPEIVEQVAVNLAPNLLCNYLFDLASKFNTFYNSNKIIVDDSLILDFRLKLTQATGTILKTGLGLLGIQAPDRM